jgi:hypothetical protein
MTVLDQNQLENKTGILAEVTATPMEREEVRQFLEALQAAESLLQDPTSAVFVTKRPLGQFKQLEALIDSFPFRSEAPLGFRQWWERSEPDRRKWLGEVKNKRAVSRRPYFALTNIPLKEFRSDALYVGSVFWVLASKDEKGRIHFSKAASGFLVPGTMANTFRHSPDNLADPEPKSAA